MPGSDFPAGGTGDLPPDADVEPALADRDQTLADSDQTVADSEQTLADRDELASARDQRASDSDQLSADQEHAERDPEIDDVAYDQSRRRRSQSTLERDLSSEARSASARLRDLHAVKRDTVAEERDRVAQERDQFMERLEAKEELEACTSSVARERAVGIELLMRAAQDRERAAALRDRMRKLREAAAHDREEAAEDRRRAAVDRQAAAAELALHGLDHLTGTLRRRPGMAAIQREMDRTARSGEPLVIVFLDVDRLKEVNDTQGHQVGDDVLRAVTGAIREDLRSYDLIVRYGGDEFVCFISGQTGSEVRKRFERIRAALTSESPDASFTIGITERRPDDTLDELVGRADTAMLDARGSRSCEGSR